MRHYIIPNRSNIFRISIFQSVDIYNSIQRFRLQRVEPRGELRRSTESNRTPFLEIARNIRLMQFRSGCCKGNRRERPHSKRVVDGKQVFSDHRGYAPPNCGVCVYPLHCGIGEWGKETNLQEENENWFSKITTKQINAKLEQIAKIGTREVKLLEHYTKWLENWAVEEQRKKEVQQDLHYVWKNEP